MKVPFNYYGCKNAVAAEVWRRFGHVRHYMEPFCGSAAVLLSRPDWKPGMVETINDIHGALVNFFRAVKFKPDEVLEWLIWPPTELDLIARQHVVLDAERELRTKLKDDDMYCDARLAAYYCYVTRIAIATPWEHRYKDLQLPSLTHSLILTPDQWKRTIRELSERLVNVRVACGHWKRIFNRRAIYVAGRPVGVFFDPPYPGTYTEAYVQSSEETFTEVLEWAKEHECQDIRIAVCGTPEVLEPLAERKWDIYVWKRVGGYCNQAKKKPRNNLLDAIAFSPSCISTLV